MGKDLVQRLPKPVAAQPTPAEPSALAIVLGNLPGQLYTLHLFTASDTVSVLIPQILFAVFASLSPTFSGSTQGGPSLGRVALATLWIKLQLLVLCISNQRQAGAFAEDALNKPWRPLPAGRLTPAAARRLLAAAVPVTFVLAVALGNAGETLALFTLNWLYNDLGMADGHWAVRNALNALGITAMGAGAARVVAEEMHGTAGQGPFARWLAVCAAVLLTTIHAQDLYDQDGDRARGRSTLPLDLGDAVARWTLAVTVLAWTLAVPVFCWLSLGGLAFRGARAGGSRFDAAAVDAGGPVRLPHLFVGGLLGCGLGFASRVLFLRHVAADKVTFKVWAIWTVCLYALPMFVPPPTTTTTTTTTTANIATTTTITTTTISTPTGI